MITVTFSELRHEAKRYFDAVERGESVEVYRNGKPVAILMPIKSNAITRWKKASPLKLDSGSLSRAIIESRRDEA